MCVGGGGVTGPICVALIVTTGTFNYYTSSHSSFLVVSPTISKDSVVLSGYPNIETRRYIVGLHEHFNNK